MDCFNITYSKWLHTHTRDHIAYQRRKRYNWAILSKINFNLANLVWNQEIRTKDKLLGNVQILTVDSQNDRYVFHIIVYDFMRSTESEFKVVFNVDGLPITIFQINDPIMNLTENFLKNKIELLDLKIDKKVAKDIFVELVSDLLIKNNLKYEKYKKFEKIIPDNEIVNILNTNGNSVELKNKYIPEFSNGRNHWLLINISAKNATKAGLNALTQCKKVTSIYLTGNPKENCFVPSNLEITSIFKYFPYHYLEPYYERLDILKGLKKNKKW